MGEAPTPSTIRAVLTISRSMLTRRSRREMFDLSDIDSRNRLARNVFPLHLYQDW